jgi:hypothetical protein
MGEGLAKGHTAMHSAIFVAVNPATEETSTNWNTFIGEAAMSRTITKNAERLAEGVWLVNFRMSPAALSFLVSAAEHRSIPYKILPLADAPQWLPETHSSSDRSS